MMQDAAQHRRLPGADALRRFWEDERGDALAEYALVTAILAMAMVGTLHLISTQGGNKLANTGSALTNQAYTP
jgi:Flp pilus assembly pilin Flp